MKDLKEKLETVYHGLSKREEAELCHEWLSYDEAHGKTTLVFTEELGELISAVSKYDGRPDQRDYDRWLHIAEEMADVQIILTMMKEQYRIDDDLLAKIRLLKLTQPIPTNSPSEEKEPTAMQNKVETKTTLEPDCQNVQEKTISSDTPLTTLVDRLILHLTEFKTMVDGIINLTMSSICAPNGRLTIVYTNPDWNNKPIKDRQFIIKKNSSSNAKK